MTCMDEYISFKITIIMGMHIIGYGHGVGITAFVYSACFSRVPTYAWGYRTLYLQFEEEPDRDGVLSLRLSVIGEGMENFPEYLNTTRGTQRYYQN